MKKVLFLTYYWPPAGGPGVQRFYYFAKKIRQFGWEPVIYTIKDGTYFALDHALEKDLPEDIEVLREKAFEPHSLYNLFSFKKKKQKINISFASEKKGFLHSLAVFIRGNFFIPDARMFWIKPSIKYLDKYLKNNKIEAIVSTSPPQSVHLIAESVSKKNNIPWIADFRDPWTKISYFKDLKLTDFARKKHINLEQNVINNADAVVSVSPSWVQDFKELGAKNCKLITNGFDEEFILPKIKPDIDKFTITFMGSLPLTRNPINFWKAIKNLIKEDSDFNTKVIIQLVGNISKDIFDFLDFFELGDKVINVGYVDHSEVYNYYLKSDLLLIVGTPQMKGHIPGKIFEYIYSETPIFNIGPEISDMTNLLDETNLGLTVDFQDELKHYTNLKFFWDNYKLGTLKNRFKVNARTLEKYSRKATTKQLVEVLNSLI